MKNIITEDIQTKVEQLAIRAALTIFNQLDEDESDVTELAKATIRATNKAHKVIEDELRKFNPEKGEVAYLGFDSICAAASAFSLFTHGCGNNEESILETIANCLAASRYIGFAQGLYSAKLFQLSMDSLKDDQDMSYCEAVIAQFDGVIA